jgi:hypothetical protein
MSLITGSPAAYTAMRDKYIEGAPYIFIQDYSQSPLYNPDSDGYYWGMTSGSAGYKPILLGCVTDVSLTEGVTMNDVRCDTTGVQDTIQKRDYVEFNITIQSVFDLKELRHILKLSSATVGTGYETVGIGGISQTQSYMVYAPLVYDETNAYWLMFHLHKAKFVDAFTWNMTYGENHKITGLKLRAFADSTKPSTQRFGVIRRFDSGGDLP